MMCALSPIKALKRDQRGSTAVEFAIIAPVFLFMVMGVFDIGHAIFIRSALDGAIQKAARDSALETGSTSAATIDAELTATVKKVAKNATVTISRQSYYSFNDVDRAETLTDTNNNGICDPGETFQDENDNLTWDTDVGAAGDGGPQDVVQYTVNVSYPALFPFKAFNSRGGKSEKITGYKTMTRPVYNYKQIKTVAVKEPQYKDITIPSTKPTIKMPTYKLVKKRVAPLTLALPVYKDIKTVSAKKFVSLPIYSVKTVKNGPTMIKLPVYEFTTVKSAVRTKQVPVYEFLPDPNAKFTTVPMQIYKMETYTNWYGKTLTRQVPDHMGLLKKFDVDDTHRVLVGYKTVPAPDTVTRKFLRYETVRNPHAYIQTRKLLGYKTIPNPRAITMTRKLMGYRIINNPHAYMLTRTFAGYKTVPNPPDLKRVLIGYKVFKRPIVQKVFVRMESYKKPIYQVVSSKYKLASLSTTRTLSATTVMKNQPFGTQAAAHPSKTRTCS